MDGFQCGPRPMHTRQLVERLRSRNDDPKSRLKKREASALLALSRLMLEILIAEPSHDLSCVLEASALAPFIDRDTYQGLFEEFINIITKGTSDSDLLHHQVLNAFNLVLRSPQSLRSEVPLQTVLARLQTRLMSAITDADGSRQLRLLCTLSAVLDNMNEIKSSGLSQKEIHKPLLEQLNTLSKSQELRLAQAAQYAYQALLGIPSDESPWKTLWVQLYPVVQAAVQVGGSVFTLDPSKLLEGLRGLQNVIPLVESVVNVIQSLSGLSENISGARRGIKTMKKQKSWYIALRFTDMMIYSNAKSQLKELFGRVPCVEEKALLCGLCAQFEQAWKTKDNSLREDIIPVLKDFLVQKVQHTKYPRVQEWVRLVVGTSEQTNSTKQVTSISQKIWQKLHAQSEKKYLSAIDISPKEDESFLECYYDRSAAL